MTDKNGNNTENKEPKLPPPRVIKHSADNEGTQTQKPSNGLDYRGSDE